MCGSVKVSGMVWELVTASELVMVSDWVIVGDKVLVSVFVLVRVWLCVSIKDCVIVVDRVRLLLVMDVLVQTGPAQPFRQMHPHEG